MKRYFAGEVSEVLDFVRSIGRPARYVYIRALVDSVVELDNHFSPIDLEEDEELEVEVDEGIRVLRVVSGRVEVIAY